VWLQSGNVRLRCSSSSRRARRRCTAPR
jgi:hypothetical protein